MKLHNLTLKDLMDELAEDEGLDDDLRARAREIGAASEQPVQRKGPRRETLERMVPLSRAMQ